MSATLVPAADTELADAFRLEVGFYFRGDFVPVERIAFTSADDKLPHTQARVEITQTIERLCRAFYDRGVADGTNTVELAPTTVELLASAFKNLPAPLVENVVNVPETPVTVNVDTEPHDATVKFKRDKNGQIVSASVTETGGSPERPDRPDGKKTSSGEGTPDVWGTPATAQERIGHPA
jgi:hypothetical protein